MDNLYSENIFYHYRNPKNYGKLNKADLSGEKRNASCGDRIIIQVKLKAEGTEGKIVEEVKFTGEGCVILIASASMLTERAEGKTISELNKLKMEDITKMLGIKLSYMRLKCALLPLEALQNTLAHSTRLKANPE